MTHFKSIYSNTNAYCLYTDLLPFCSQAVSPALEQLKAILEALDLPQLSKESTVFDLFSQIEAKVSVLQYIYDGIISVF